MMAATEHLTRRVDVTSGQEAGWLSSLSREKNEILASFTVFRALWLVPDFRVTPEDEVRAQRVDKRWLIELPHLSE